MKKIIPFYFVAIMLFSTGCQALSGQPAPGEKLPNVVFLASKQQLFPQYR